MSRSFALLVPVKTLALAKSRLRTPTADRRSALMRAFALDALAAAAAARSVSAVYVVSDEPGFEAEGVEVLPDHGDGDLNAALRLAAHGVRLRDPATGVAALCADLPGLRAEDLDTALDAGLSPRWYVADAAGTGTTLLAAGPGVDLDPHFGAGSARRHEESGAVAVRAEVAGLRQDVDTDEDLARARAIGVGRHTAALLDG